jgi:hypothetical protein
LWHCYANCVNALTGTASNKSFSSPSAMGPSATKQLSVKPVFYS